MKVFLVRCQRVFGSVCKGECLTVGILIREAFHLKSCKADASEVTGQNVNVNASKS